MKPQSARCLVFAFIAAFTVPASADERIVGPWNLDALSKTPEFTWADETGTVRGLYYAGQPYRGQATRVFAYFGASRQRDRKLPAMVLVHGGGGKAFKEWVELWVDRGYAAIALDLGGCGPDGVRLDDAGPAQDDAAKFGDLPVEESWTYHAVADIIAAVSLLQSFPEIDSDKIGVTGISWGGYLTSIVCGVDDRLKVAVPVYGCGFLDQNSVWIPTFDKMTAEQRTRWVKLFDPSQYLAGCRMPILFVNGTNDFAYPLDSYQKSYRLVAGPRNLCVTVEMPHGHPEGWAPKEIGVFVDSVLTGGTPLARFDKVERAGAEVTATFQAPEKIVKAALHYTTDTVTWNQRKWHSIDAKLGDLTVTAALPQPTGIAWFLTITDERGATVSTEHELVE